MRAAALKLDMHPQLLAAARRMRHRLPGDDKFGDPLSTVGDTPVEVVARSVAAIRNDERESVAHELGMSALQVWQSLSEATGRGRGDRPVALLFTDLVGFSSWALKAGDEVTVELLRAVDRAEKATIVARGGAIVKRMGDGLMAVFDDPTSAVDAALDALDAISVIEIGGYAPRMRAGVHWGAPRKLGGDYLGVDVNTAARVADAAGADELLVSEAALQLVSHDGLRIGRAKRLKAQGAPRDTYISRVQRAL
jgi:class 3 adenylate cyclase